MCIYTHIRCGDKNVAQHRKTCSLQEFGIIILVVFSIPHFVHTPSCKRTEMQQGTEKHSRSGPLSSIHACASTLPKMCRNTNFMQKRGSFSRFAKVDQEHVRQRDMVVWPVFSPAVRMRKEIGEPVRQRKKNLQHREAVVGPSQFQEVFHQLLVHIDSDGVCL